MIMKGKQELKRNLSRIFPVSLPTSSSHCDKEVDMENEGSLIYLGKES